MRNLIGKKDLSPLNIIVRLGIDGNDPAKLNGTAWEGLNLVTVNKRWLLASIIQGCRTIIQKR
jgi:hypothetical protein